MTLGDEIRDRYPRLVRAVARGSGLSEPDAVTALVEHRIFGITGDSATKAIARAGGPLAAIRRGIRCRHARTAGGAEPAGGRGPAPPVDTIA